MIHRKCIQDQDSDDPPDRFLFFLLSRLFIVGIPIVRCDLFLRCAATHLHRRRTTLILPSMGGLLVDTEVPPYVQRVHVLTGYRPLLREDQSLLIAALRSSFTLHNETFNIWSHLLGFVWLLSRLRALFMLPTSEVADNAPEGMRLSVIVFTITAAFCLAASTIAHCFAGIVSRTPSDLLWRIDSYGIAVLIGGSWLPGLAFGFRCRQSARMMYSIIVVGLLVIATIGSALASVGRPHETPIAERMRVGGLACGVAFGLVPLAHFYMIAPDDEVAIFLPSVLYMLACYFIGFLFYSTGLPESVRPGMFDLRGGSHLLWHVAVLAAIRHWDAGVWNMLLHKDSEVCQGWDMEGLN